MWADMFSRADRKLFTLAPMAGFTNSACRSIFSEYGADATVSEFVYSRAVLKGAARVLEKLAFEDGARPVGIQIFGDDPSEIADAAQLIRERLSPDFIDINFGCPAPNAVDAGAGAALLKDVPRMCAIVQKVSESLDIPVTAKMRTGWDSQSIVVPDAAVALEQAGAKMVCLHGRTKAQAYGGDADWRLIEQTARSLEIPLWGNGSAEKLDADFLRGSACAGFSIGRAALGNPWVFRRLKAAVSGEPFEEPTPRERAALALRYAETMAESGFDKSSPDNIKFIKTQIMCFLKNAEGFKRLRVRLKDINTLSELKELLCGQS